MDFTTDLRLQTGKHCRIIVPMVVGGLLAASSGAILLSFNEAPSYSVLIQKSLGALLAGLGVCGAALGLRMRLHPHPEQRELRTRRAEMVLNRLVIIGGLLLGLVGVAGIALWF